MNSNQRIQQLVEEVTARPGFTKAIGTRVLSVEAGSVSMALDRRADLLQSNGYFHGGVISALADHAAGGAVTTALPAGRFVLTVDLHVNFLAPARGDTLVAHAKAVKVGSVIGVAHVELATIGNGAEELCAIATATMRATEMPAGLPAAGAESDLAPPSEEQARRPALPSGPKDRRS